MVLGRLPDNVRDAAKDLVEVSPEPPVHHVVDDRVDTGVGHRQPVEREVHVANVRLPDEHIHHKIRETILHWRSYLVMEG